MTPVSAAIIAAASVATSFPVPAHAGPASAASAGDAVRWQSFIDEAASRFSVPASWIRAVIRIESNGNPNALSPKGAVGLMQLMPGTYAELRVRYRLGADPKDPHDNIIAGTAYLRDMHARFGTEGCIAAYNAGPQRYEEHLATGRPLPDETRVYVAKLAPLLSGGFVGHGVRIVSSCVWLASVLAPGVDALNQGRFAAPEGVAIENRILIKWPSGSPDDAQGSRTNFSLFRRYRAVEGARPRRSPERG